MKPQVVPHSPAHYTLRSRVLTERDYTLHGAAPTLEAAQEMAPEGLEWDRQSPGSLWTAEVDGVRWSVWGWE